MNKNFLNNKGYCLLISVYIFLMIFIMTMALLDISLKNHTIVDSDIMSTQSYYLAENKCYLCYYDEKYFNNEIMPRIEYYLRSNRLIDYKYGNSFKIDESDLMDGDNERKVIIQIIKDENSELVVNINTGSNYKGFRKSVQLNFSPINPIYEKGYGIIYRDMPSEFDGFFC